MGVYIPKAKKPKNCEDCVLRKGNIHCLVDGKHLDNFTRHYRRDDCPLVEVKEPHGRLIDADVVLSNIGAFADHPNETLVNDLAIAFD